MKSLVCLFPSSLFSNAHFDQRPFFADLIIVLKEGQVIEQGWHEDLVRLKGHYYT
jgi:ABC-type bacteriocin/lantibiotic exporter with double-glycine peptidase domain